MKLIALIPVAVVVVILIGDATSSTLGQMCHECITRDPSWAMEPCQTAPVTCQLGSYCTKANFGKTLTIRGCAPDGGKDKDFTKEGKVCKKTSEYMTSNYVSAALKKEFQDRKALFEKACPAGNFLTKGVKHFTRAERKGFTCKKKLCNAGARLDSSAAGVLILAIAATYFAKKNVY